MLVKHKKLKVKHFLHRLNYFWYFILDFIFYRELDSSRSESQDLLLSNRYSFKFDDHDYYYIVTKKVYYRDKKSLIEYERYKYTEYEESSRKYNSLLKEQ